MDICIFSPYTFLFLTLYFLKKAKLFSIMPTTNKIFNISKKKNKNQINIYIFFFILTNNQK